MRLVDVDASWVEAFKDYARLHGAEHDDSYTLSEELELFEPAGEPAALAVSDRGEVVGAGSLMAKGFVTAGLARFRILHAIQPGVYGQLLARLLTRVPAGVGRVFLFLPPDAPAAVRECLAGAGFRVSRRAYVLSARGQVPAIDARAPLPPGVRARPAGPESAGEWSRVLNLAFAGQPGRYDMSVGRACDLLSRQRLVPGGTLIAVDGGRAVGAVMSVADDEDSTTAEIETLCVVPDRQGEGVGRGLLTAALTALHSAGFDAVELSVSVANEAALKLYLGLGFSVAEERVCWELALPRSS